MQGLEEGAQGLHDPWAAEEVPESPHEDEHFAKESDQVSKSTIFYLQFSFLFHHVDTLRKLYRTSRNLIGTISFIEIVAFSDSSVTDVMCIVKLQRY